MLGNRRKHRFNLDTRVSQHIGQTPLVDPEFIGWAKHSISIRISIQKIYIQAKRYKNVVGVAAVRDLYGTMINEGASKGILVTTSHYGPDAYDFAKDKPIELIDGTGIDCQDDDENLQQEKTDAEKN